MANERREFSRNYENCFVSMPLTTGGRRAYIVKGEDGIECIQGATVSLTYRESLKSHSFNDFLTSWRPIVPVSGYFNVTPDSADGWITALFVKLRPERQYRKGFPSDNQIVEQTISSSPFFSEAWRALSAASNGDSIFVNKVLATHLAQGGGRNLVTLRQAAELVESGKHHSVAFSKFFCLALRNGIKYPVVLYGQQLAGVYKDSTVWGLDPLLPLKDFFWKKWGVAVYSITEYKQL